MKYAGTLKHAGLLAGTAVIAMSGFSVAHAQEKEDAVDDNVIIVTATHRAVDIQDIPVTVSVLGGDAIAKADIHDPTGIAANTPGLAYSEFSPGQAQFSMRGVGSGDDGAGLDNSVAVFLDGVYIGRGAGVNFDAFDLERIEVLKGPQGALFGRNTIGGAVSVVTQKPSSDLQGKASITYGNFDTFRVQGLLSGGLTDSLSAKLVVNHRQHDGYVRNTLLNKDVADEQTTSVRGQLLYEKGPAEFLLSADYMRDEREDAGRFPFVSPFVPLAESLGANRPFTTASPIEGFTNREQHGVSLQGDIDVGIGTIVTITGYRSVQTDWEMPSVGAPLGGLDLANGQFGFDLIDDIEESVKTLSQEVRFVSDFGGDFNFVTGLFYFFEDTDRVEQFRLERNSVAGGQVAFANEYTRTRNQTESFAAYGQATWDIGDQWSLVFGGRVTHDKKDYEATAVDCGQPEAARAAAGFPNFPQCVDLGGSVNIVSETFRVPAEASFTNFSPMGSIQFRPNDDIMIFGTVATGFKSGGFAGSQGVASAADDLVDPEKATNYELGVKTKLFSNRLLLNATAFFTDYRGLQVVRFGPVPGSTFGSFLTTNIGSADIKGVEVDWNWELTEFFTFSGNYAFLDTEANDLVINGVDVSGVELRQAPRHSLNLVADFNFPLASGELNINGQFTHVSQQRTDFLSDDTIIEEQNTFDARMAWTSPSEAIEVAVWGKNLTNTAYVPHSYIVGPGTIGIWNAPRTYGVTLTGKF